MIENDHVSGNINLWRICTSVEMTNLKKLETLLTRTIPDQVQIEKRCYYTFCDCYKSCKIGPVIESVTHLFANNECLSILWRVYVYC